MFRFSVNHPYPLLPSHVLNLISLGFDLIVFGKSFEVLFCVVSKEQASCNSWSPFIISAAHTTNKQMHCICFCIIYASVAGLLYTVV